MPADIVRLSCTYRALIGTLSCVVLWLAVGRLTRAISRGWSGAARVPVDIGRRPLTRAVTCRRSLVFTCRRSLVLVDFALFAKKFLPSLQMTFVRGHRWSRVIHKAVACVISRPERVIGEDLGTDMSVISHVSLGIDPAARRARLAQAMRALPRLTASVAAVATVTCAPVRLRRLRWSAPLLFLCSQGRQEIDRFVRKSSEMMVRERRNRERRTIASKGRASGKVLGFGRQ